MFNSTSSEPLLEMLPYAGGIFGVGLFLFGLLVVGLIVIAIVVYLFKRNSAAPVPVSTAPVNSINLADGLDDDEVQRIKKFLDDQTEREKDAATRDKILTAIGASTEKPTGTAKK